MSITVLGTVGYDTIEVPDGLVRRVLGGSGLHVAAAASRFARTSLVGRVGVDFKRTHRKRLEVGGIRLQDLDQDSNALTFSWHGRYPPDLGDAATISRNLGAMANWSPRLSAVSRSPNALILGSAEPRIQRQVLDQSEATFTCLDSREAWIREHPEALLALAREVDLVCLNEYELRALTGRTDADGGARWLLDRGTHAVAVKRGRRGASLFAGRRRVDVGAYPAAVVDPTGAGDAFVGALVGHLVEQGSDDWEGGDLEGALAAAATLASFAIEGFGASRLLDLPGECYRARLRCVVASANNG